MNSVFGITLAALSAAVILTSCFATTEGLKIKEYVNLYGLMSSWHSCKKTRGFVDCSNAVKKHWRYVSLRTEFHQLAQLMMFKTALEINNVVSLLKRGDVQSMEKAKRIVGEEGVRAFAEFILSLSYAERMDLFGAFFGNKNT